MTRSAFSSVHVEEPARPVDVRVVRQWAGRFIAVTVMLYMQVSFTMAILVMMEENPPGFQKCTFWDWWWNKPVVQCGVRVK